MSLPSAQGPAFLDKLNAVAYNSTLCTHAVSIRGMSRGHRGLCCHQRPRSQQPYFLGFALLHQRPDRERCKTPGSCVRGAKTSQGEFNPSLMGMERSLLVVNAEVSSFQNDSTGTERKKITASEEAP